MNRFKIFFMMKKPSLNDFAQPEMTKDAKTVVLAAFESAKKEQDKILKQAKSLK